MAGRLECMGRIRLPVLAKTLNIRVDIIGGETYQQLAIQQPGKRPQVLLTSFLLLE
jgi:hypothetical protein